VSPVKNGEENKDEPEELDEVDADTLAKQQQEQDAMVEEQKQARPLLQKQNEMSLQQNQPVLVDNDQELDKILEVSYDLICQKGATNGLNNCS
jgi:hypothetical protein